MLDREPETQDCNQRNLQRIGRITFAKVNQGDLLVTISIPSHVSEAAYLLRKSLVTHFKMSNTLTVLTNMPSEKE